MTFISKQDALALYPALAIELSQSQLSSDIFTFLGDTEHQKEAALLAEKICKWHHIYILEFCPHMRPSLRFDVSVQKKITLDQWHESCRNWTNEHETPTDILAESWAKEITGNAIAKRLYEPLDRTATGLIISAHDHNALSNA